MFRKGIVLSIFTILLCAAPAMADMRIAVMDFDVPDMSLSAKEAAGISDLIRSEMINIGLFKVIERAQLGKILKEQGLQQTGCTDTSCAVQIGQLLSARKILVGSIMRMGDSYIINGRIVDVEKGTADYSSKEKAVSKNDLDRSVEQFVVRLADQIALKAEEKELAAKWKKWKDNKRAEESRKSAAQRIYVPTNYSYGMTSTLGVYSLTFMILGGAEAGVGWYFKTEWESEKKKQRMSLYTKYLFFYMIYPTLPADQQSLLLSTMSTHTPISTNKTLYQTFFWTGVGMGGAGFIMGVVWTALKIRDRVAVNGDFKLPGSLALITPLSCRYREDGEQDFRPSDWRFGVRYQF